ncbi:MAG: thiol:disulfide oxidoreductase [Alphaproteobacteria bacterium]|nr:MAG: thiol:disulfide oxidoreductase [Alphaproteobacteria bacterium]
MIDLHYWPTPNGWKVTIMLEETGLDYNVIPVDIGMGAQFEPEFMKISPNNRMPALVDHDPIGGGDPISVFESGAMLEYLADKTGQFLPTDPQGRYKVLQWVHWQMANLGPMMGNANHFKNYGPTIADLDKLEYGINRFVGEVNRLSGVMDKHLANNEYFGDDYSIADMIIWSWAMLLPRTNDNTEKDFPNLIRWIAQVKERPAVQKGYKIGKEWRDRKRTPEEEEKSRKILFGQTAKSVSDATEKAS